ncbi:unnamed protein product [Adineta ricciae]|uniref:Uncharacterized protein n=2 Tax=Adineta ricciae TaxID=249248 RepID=A0A814V1I8_ADIRI|nr:unnamed protein product [Adineta ricciae]
MDRESKPKILSNIQIYLKQPWDLIKTGYLILTWITMGFHLELIGPTMPILAANIQVTYSGMGSVLASRSAGYLVANCLGATLQSIVKNHSEGLLFCAFVLPAIVVFATPFITSLILMCIVSFAQGISKGFTDLGGNNLLLKMWTVNASAPLNAVHLGYGVGAVFANLLIRPFLTNRNIFVPYSITAFVCLLIALGHMFLYILEIRNRRQKSRVEEVEESLDKSSPYSPRTCGRGSFQYGLILSIMFIAYTFFVGGNYQTFSKFYFSFLKFEKFKLSNEDASWGMTLFWLSSSIGRFIFAIISIFLSVNICLSIIWAGAICLAAAWLTYVWIVGLSSMSLFILGAITGLIFSPIFPLSFGYFNQRLNVIPMLLGLLLCGTALGAMTSNKIAGLVMDHDPNHFPTLLAIWILMATLLYIGSHLVYFCHRRPSADTGRECVNEEEKGVMMEITNKENK